MTIQGDKEMCEYHIFALLEITTVEIVKKVEKNYQLEPFCSIVLGSS
jgi:hypothetical protein